MRSSPTNTVSIRADSSDCEASAVTLGLDETDLPAPNAGRLVEVAVDAAGGRSQTYTYLVPKTLSDLVVG